MVHRRNKPATPLRHVHINRTAKRMNTTDSSALLQHCWLDVSSLFVDKNPQSVTERSEACSVHGRCSRSRDLTGRKLSAKFAIHNPINISKRPNKVASNGMECFRFIR